MHSCSISSSVLRCGLASLTFFMVTAVSLRGARGSARLMLVLQIPTKRVL